MRRRDAVRARRARRPSRVGGDLGAQPGDEVVDRHAPLDLAAARVDAHGAVRPRRRRRRRARRGSSPAWPCGCGRRAARRPRPPRPGSPRPAAGRPARRRSAWWSARTGSTRDLHRRQPRREGAGVCSSSTPKNRSNEPNSARWIIAGPVALVVGADVLEVEAVRELEVDLDGRQLPAPADGVADVDVDLRGVERALALGHHVGDARRLDRLAQRRLGLAPTRRARPRTCRAGSPARPRSRRSRSRAAAAARTPAGWSARRRAARACRRCASRPG